MQCRFTHMCIIKLGITHYFQHFRKSTESTLGEGGKIHMYAF